MRQAATVRFFAPYRLAVYAFLLSTGLTAQTLEWRRVGSTTLVGPYPSPAGGPVERVWYAPDGSKLFARTGAGRVYETSDFETWSLGNSAAPPPIIPSSQGALPEPGLRLRAGGRLPAPDLYGFGTAVFRSSDEGKTWQNMTDHRGDPILGGPLADLAVSPFDKDEVVVASATGLWRSLDGGLTWAGLNDGLPNLPARKLIEVAGPDRFTRIELQSGEALWPPGRRGSWVQAGSGLRTDREQARLTAGRLLSVEVRALASSGDVMYAGASEGRLWVSANRGRTWQPFQHREGGVVEGIWVNAENPRVALAALAGVEGQGGRILRTVNAGIFWDDLTANLPSGPIHGVAADGASGAMYAATAAGLFVAYTDFANGASAAPWARAGGALPPAEVLDVKLDAGGDQLYALLEGHGVYATLAPHRLRNPRVVNAADGSTRPAAPGTLLSVLGASVSSARAGTHEAPVLGSAGSESQIQVPFEVRGSSLTLALASGGTSREFSMPLREASPAIFSDRDGAPVILDADRGVLLEPAIPARPGSRIQILATGLGRVTPDWPTGLAAPTENAPRVVAPVRVFVDRQPVEVLRATLAPGYVGFYIIEVQMPDIVNSGPAELFLEAGGEPSGRVSLLLAQ